MTAKKPAQDEVYDPSPITYRDLPGELPDVELPEIVVVANPDPEPAKPAAKKEN